MQALQKQIQFGIMAWVIISLVLLCGCIEVPDEACIKFSNLTINGKQANLLLDTGAGSTVLTSSAAERLGITVIPVPQGSAKPPFMADDSSVPAKILFDNNTYVVPLPVLREPWYTRLFIDKVDGAVGWHVIRNNILFFDADSHVVRQLAELPPNTSDWLKLKIKEAPVLQLEIPQVDGTTGIVLVDSGSPMGLALPAAQWKEWREAHPKAPSQSIILGGPSMPLINLEEAWADDIKLGPITFTDMPVYESDSNIDSAIKHYAGSLGMYALERMNLIIDGPNGFAYLQPRPSPGPPYPHIHKLVIKNELKDGNTIDKNWVVGSGVELNFVNELMKAAENKWLTYDNKGAIQYYTQVLDIEPQNTDAHFKRGRARWNVRDVDGALADFNEVIERDTQNADAFYGRGLAEGQRGEYAKAIADFTKGLELDPRKDEAYLNRALTKRYLGDEAGAILDCTKAIELNPQRADSYYTRAVSRQIMGDFVEALPDYDMAIELKLAHPGVDHPHLYRDLLQLKLGDTAPTPAKNVPAWKDEWTMALDQFLAGSLDEKKLLTTAEEKHTEAVVAQRCEAYYFIGEVQLAHGDKQGALNFFEKCVDSKQPGLLESSFAHAEMVRLDEGKTK